MPEVEPTSTVPVSVTLWSRDLEVAEMALTLKNLRRTSVTTTDRAVVTIKHE